MTHSQESPPIEGRLKPDWYLYWQHEIYRILPQNHEDALRLDVENVTTSERRSISLIALWGSGSDNQYGQTTAPTLERLHKEIEKLQPPLEAAPTKGISAELLQKADKIITTYEQVEHTTANLLKSPNANYTLTAARRQACTLLKPPIELSTFYNYRNRINTSHGDRTQIASSLHRSTYGQMRLDKVQLHFLDTMIPLFYRADRASKPASVFRLADSALKFYTSGQWVDPNKCEKGVPEDLVSELIQVLHEDLPMQAILDNKEKKALLSEVGMPSLGCFYQYFRWFEAQPDQGRKALNSRYGEGTWEKFYMTFDTFVHQASFPLQYVFADHYLLDVFTVDKATRSKVDRLWLTLLIDAYSRCILGMALLYEKPCIESIQSALLHAIWPKESHTKLGIQGQWACIGIPHQLSLDNAWAHHSHSLENLARRIGHKGKYHTIDLVFRPPYRARYGALIENCIGNLSSRIKQDLVGAIQSSKPEHVRKAAKEACLLYDDVNRYIQQYIVQYQHREHSALGGMTPHAKWIEATQRIGLPDIPRLTPTVKRFFLRESPTPKNITGKGVSAFGMNYISEVLNTAEKIEKNKKDEEQKVQYSFSYDPEDISAISLFREEKFVGDLFAKELRLSDGTMKPTSLWEVKLAKELAKEKDGKTENWLSYLNDAEKLKKKRRAEKDRIHRDQRRQEQEGKMENEIDLEESTDDLPLEDDTYMTELLVGFHRNPKQD